MKSWEDDGTLVIREIPAILWMLGGMFVVIGSVFVFGTLGGFHNASELAAWERIAAFVFGVVAVFVGIWVIWRAPVTKVRIDRHSELVSVDRKGLFISEHLEYSIANIQEFCVIEDLDTEGDPIFSLGFRLTDGTEFEVSSLQSHSEDFKRRFAFETNEYLGKRLPSVTDDEPRILER